MIRRKLASIALTATTSLILTACGGSDSSSAGNSSTSGASATGTISTTTSTATTTTTATTPPTSTASDYSISGSVAGLTGVAVVLKGATSTTASTNASGAFSFTSLGAGNYAVAPSQTGYIVTPVSIATTVKSASVSGLAFGATATTASTYTLSGTVTGSAVAGVIITLNGSNIGSTLTDSSGNYSFGALPSGTYTLTASLPGYSFSTPLIVSPNTTDLNTQNFMSIAAPTATGLTLNAVATLPQATAGTPYSASVGSISGGTAPYYFESDTFQSGTPPLGMIVNPNGNVTGTASVPGQYSFSVCATDAAGETTPCQAVSLTVAAPTSTTPPGTTTAAAPTVKLSADSTSLTKGASTTLTWSSTNATACSASGGWSGAKNASGSANITPAATTTYTLTCTGPGGSFNASTSVMVKSVTAAGAPTVKLTSNTSTITPGNSATLTWSTTNASSCVASGGWTGTEATSGSHSESPTTTTTYTLSCTGMGGNATASTTVTVGASSTPVTPPSGAFWVYYNGKFNWGGDFDFVLKSNYADTSGGPLSGSYDIENTTTSPYGGWLPYAQNFDFNSAGYTKLTFALKPTVANQQWQVYFVKVGDVPVGIYLNVLDYGPAPVVGQWNTYTVPLKDLGVLGTAIYKFCIQDMTGRSSNTWYVDNVGFVP